MLRSVVLLLALTFGVPAAAQIHCSEGLQAIDRQADARLSPMDFIRNVTINEAVFAKAFANYGHRLEVKLQTLKGDQVDGEYRRVSVVSFEGNGQRQLKVEEGPDTIKFGLPKATFEALRDGFAITPDIISDRDIVYSGRQRFPDFNAAVFDILARDNLSDRQAFTGRVWVRQRDNAIARACGRAHGGPFGPMRYLAMRERIDEKYYFPSLIRADDTVKIDDKDVRVRVRLQYSDYKAR
jgi:hypothetical protein